MAVLKEIAGSELFKAMQQSGHYENDNDILETFNEMRERVSNGEDPEEVLYDEGFEPDYILDLID